MGRCPSPWTGLETKQSVEGMYPRDSSGWDIGIQTVRGFRFYTVARNWDVVTVVGGRFNVWTTDF